MRLTKSLVAIAAASALFVLAATPASAASHTFGPTTGTLTNTVLGTVVFAGTGSPTPPCTNLSADADTITIFDNTTGGLTVTSVNITTSLGTSPSYMVAITKHTGSNAGTVNTTTLTVAQDLSLKVVFSKAVNTSGTCVLDTSGSPPNPICTVRLDFNTTVATQLTGSISAYPPTSPTTTLTLSGTGKFATSFQTCNLPFSSILSLANSLATMTFTAHALT